jgi:hypothetical protein
MENIAQSSPIVIRKNAREELRLSVDEYHGYPFASFRVWYRDDDSGEMRPSRKGLTVSPDNWPLFIAGLRRLEGELQQRGLLEGDTDL